MIQYKLIKEYPGSPKIGTIHNCENKISEWQGTIFYDSHPEFWQKVEELDYEILSFIAKLSRRVYEKQGNDKYVGIGISHNYTLEELLNRDLFSIHSVKRLSDGEVFTIGDRVKSKRGTNNDSSLVTKIYIDTNKDAKPVGGLIVQKGGYYQAKISEIEKLKTPLFTTEDGVEIFEGDEYSFLWLSNPAKNQSIYTLYTCKAEPLEKNASWSQYAKFFSSKENAEEFIIQNKPCLSLTDVSKHYKALLSFSNGNSRGLREIVKSRL